jgi:hypothetical protein
MGAVGLAATGTEATVGRGLYHACGGFLFYFQKDYLWQQ